ncbi:MAG: hypothetical protein AAGF36_06250 [Pseudomonadota bacterium]
MAAILISLICIGWMARFDPKRRRSFGLSPRAIPVSRRVIWVGMVLPGLLLALAGQSAGFVLWLSALCVFGWLVVRVPPPAYRAARDRALQAATRLCSRLRG